MMNLLLCLTLILTIVGGLNWGAHAANYNLVDMVVPAPFNNYVYYLVAASALVVLLAWMMGNISCKKDEEEEKKEKFEF
jgi:uncharacterized membrane protein YuzA (DUF378 family)